jgi:hypothetical protein
MLQDIALTLMTSLLKLFIHGQKIQIMSGMKN